MGFRTRLCEYGCMPLSLSETEVLIPEADIAQRVDELADEVAHDYEALFLVGVLTGAHVLTADFERGLYRHGMLDVRVGFMGVRSYEDEQVSSGEPRITLDLEQSIADQDVLIVEDLADTGYSIELLLALLSARGPRSLSVLALLSKEEKRVVNVPIRYKGFDIPNVYVYGYGVDDGHQDFRILPFIGYKRDS